VIGSTVLLTTLGQDMKSKSTAIATYHVPQLGRDANFPARPAA
jgi:hypothetical protein